MQASRNSSNIAMKKISKTKNGFGLIETLIACAILIILVGALMVLNVVITNSIIFTKERLVAYNLAQEGIETTRQIRSTNLIDGDDKTNWNFFVCKNGRVQAPETGQQKTYEISHGHFADCAPNAPGRYFLIESSGEDITISGHTYKRKITFDTSGIDPKVVSDTGADVTNENAIRVIVTVDWEGKSVDLREVLTNWKQVL